MHDNHSSDSLKLFPDSTFEDVYTIISRDIHQIIIILLRTVMPAMKSKCGRVGREFYLCSSLAISS